MAAIASPPLLLRLGRAHSLWSRSPFAAVFSKPSSRRIFFGFGASVLDQLGRMTSLGSRFSTASARPQQDVSPVEQVCL